MVTKYKAAVFIIVAMFSSIASAAYTTMTIEGVKQVDGVWTAAGVVDNMGFVRTTGAVTVAGTTASTAVALPVEMGAASKILRIAGKLAGPAAVALAGYDLYKAFENAKFVNVNGKWMFVSGGKPADVGTSSICSDGSATMGYINCYTPLPDQNASCAARGSEFGAQGKIYTVIQGSSPWYYCHEIFAPKSQVTPNDGHFNTVNFNPAAIAQGFNNLPSLSGQPIPITGIKFGPYSQWYGDPYFRDGNWWRDRMDVSPAPTSSQPTRVRVDIGPVKIEGATNPGTVPDTGPAGGTGGAPQPEKETPTFCEANPMSIACAEMGELKDEKLEVEERPVDVSYTPWGSSTSQCPADKVIPLWDEHSLRISYSPVCQFASLLRPLVIALAFVAAGFIVAGITRKGAES